MKVMEYLEKLDRHCNVTFIKARARKDANTPFYHTEYQTTILDEAENWLEANYSPILDSIILNDRQPSITWLSGADWNTLIKAGIAKCLLVVSPKDYEMLIPGKEQRERLELYIERQMKK